MDNDTYLFGLAITERAHYIKKAPFLKINGF